MQPEKRTRRKPIKSCLECNRRKQKCNRQQPCNHCIGRGVERLCVYSNAHPSRTHSRGRNVYHAERRSSSTTTIDQSEPDRETSVTLSSYDSDSTSAGVETLEALGYASPGTNGLLTSSFYPLDSPPLVGPKRTALPSPRMTPQSRSCLKSWPERAVMDFLVTMFLHEINRAFEMVDPLSFQSRYMAWWIDQEKKEVQNDFKASEDDLDFGLLMLRVSLLSIQCLPHARYPTAGVFKAPMATIEQWLNNTADEIEKTISSKKPTLTTVQHRFYHVLYLKNYARVRECWATLSATVKDAHEIGLHLKDPGVPVTELEREFRRRAFWNLYIWDRFHSAFFGHWPLIPEGYFDIELPIDNLQPLQVTPYMLTPFTDRIFHIKLARFLTAFMSPPSWKQDQITPTIIEDFAERFKQVIVDPLPPPYWLDNPDTSWDAVEPTFPSKREMLHMFLLGTQASLYRAFSDPCDSLLQNKKAVFKHRTDFLALTHRRKLMDINCKVIPSIARLYVLSGDEDGGMPERLFLFPTSLVEALAALGVCLLSIQADERNLLLDGIRFDPDADLRHSYAVFFDGFNLLCRQGQKHSIAKRGVKILESLHGTLRASLRSPDLLNSENGGVAIQESHGPNNAPQAGGYQLEHALVSFHRKRGEGAQLAPTVALPEWLPSFMESPGRSWLFHDMSAYGDLLA